MSQSREREITLRIRAEDPERIADELANLAVLAEYQLVPKPDVIVRDVYLDTREEDLRSLKIALRLRKFDDQWMITLKGPTSSTTDGIPTRREIEKPWSLEALREVLTELAKLGVTIRGEEFTNACDNPEQMISDSRVVSIQDRINRRQIREAVAPGENDAVLAELVIDRVAFCVDGCVVRHYEVELEARSGSTAEIRSLASALCQQYPDALEPWTVSKLATGMAIEELADAGGISEFLTDKHVLQDDAYRRISESK